MKTLIVLVLGLLAVGCLTPEQKQKRLRDSVVGEYERKLRNVKTLHKYVYLENGIVEIYVNDRYDEDGKWAIVDGELHAFYGSPYVTVFKINRDKSITKIAIIFKGKREIAKGTSPYTLKKIK